MGDSTGAYGPSPPPPRAPPQRGPRDGEGKKVALRTARVQVGDEDVLRDRLARIATAFAIELLVKLEFLQHAAQLRDGRRMDVDPDVDVRIVQPVDDLDGRRPLRLVGRVIALPAGVPPPFDCPHAGI